ncbi:MAG: hypothetical protein WCP01_14180 [Methylococcaceae bacterium]
MDICVYSIKSVTNEKIASLIEQRASFVLEDIDTLNISESVKTVEKLIESKGLSCRVYLKGRSATVAAAAIPISPTVIGGWAAALAIGIHDLATWNPDYEIAKNIVTGTLSINYKK